MTQSNDRRNELKRQTNDSLIRFTLKGKTSLAKVVSIYDGDTCDLAFYLDDQTDNVVRYKCRMSGYDAPELDEPNGEVARNYLAHLCLGQDPGRLREITKDNLQNKLDNSKTLVFAKFGREGKYGRPVVTLHPTSPRANKVIDDIIINNQMAEFLQSLEQNPQE